MLAQLPRRERDPVPCLPDALDRASDVKGKSAGFCEGPGVRGLREGPGSDRLEKDLRSRPQGRD